MINSEIFALDANKQKQKNGKKKGAEEITSAIIEEDEESSHAVTSPGEDEPTDDEDSDGNDSDSLEASVSSGAEESHTSSKSKEANEVSNAQSTMVRVLAMVESGREVDGSEFDPEADKEEYCNECDDGFEDKL